MALWVILDMVGLVIDYKSVYMFCSAEGLWKAGKNEQVLYRLGYTDPNFV